MIRITFGCKTGSAARAGAGPAAIARSNVAPRNLRIIADGTSWGESAGRGRFGACPTHSSIVAEAGGPGHEALAASLGGSGEATAQRSMFDHRNSACRRAAMLFEVTIH